MVRYTITSCAQLHGPSFNLSEHPVDIQHGGQLAESYLCEVNPKGTVPVLVILTPDDPQIIISESIDITYCLGGPCPNLFPENQVEQIKQLLEELHEINYFSLTYTHAPQRASDMVNAVQTVLSKPNISSRYREALNHKLELVRTTRFPALTAAKIATEEEKTLTFLSKVNAHLDLSGSSWIFGTAEPTALDTHTVPLIARLIDVGREEMLSIRVKDYALRAFETEEWKAIMEDRKTVFGSYL